MVAWPFAWKYIYSDKELNAITPAPKLQWMNFRSFGTINLLMMLTQFPLIQQAIYNTGRKQHCSGIPTCKLCGGLVTINKRTRRAAAYRLTI
jgi:hypothetical protein